MICIIVSVNVALCLQGSAFLHMAVVWDTASQTLTLYRDGVSRGQSLLQETVSLFCPPQR